MSIGIIELSEELGALAQSVAPLPEPPCVLCRPGDPCYWHSAHGSRDRIAGLTRELQRVQGELEIWAEILPPRYEIQGQIELAAERLSETISDLGDSDERV